MFLGYNAFINQLLRCISVLLQVIIHYTHTKLWNESQHRPSRSVMIHQEFLFIKFPESVMKPPPKQIHWNHCYQCHHQHVVTIRIMFCDPCQFTNFLAIIFSSWELQIDQHWASICQSPPQAPMLKNTFCSRQVPLCHTNKGVSMESKAEK